MKFPVSLPTRSYYRIAVSTFFFIMGFTFASWANRIPDIKKMLHLNDAQLGGLLFSLPVGQLVAMGLSGYLISKYSSKKMLRIAVLVYPLALVFLGTVQHAWQLSLGLFFMGMFGNLCGISINTQGVGVERLYGRSIMASFHGVWSLAGFTGGLLATLMVSFDITPLIHFCIVYGITFSLMLSMRNWVLPRDAKPAEKAKKTFRPGKEIVYLGIIVFGSMICEGTMFDWSGIYFESIIQPPKELVRMGYIAFMFTMTAGRFTADKLVTKFGAFRILRVAGVIITTGLLTAVIFPYLVTATIGFLLVGIGTSSVVPLCYSIAGRSKDMHPSVAITTVASIGFAGFLLGPPLIGFISQLSNLRWSFALVAILGLLTTIISAKMNRTK
ncbi:MAG TPA: MFS transporter, partial [Bacteroidales bacterium]|nr:MFS transporter [Bacteroidales bacterium]